MVEIQVKLVNNNRPGRKLKELKGIIVHWTANVKPTAGAESHLKYFGHTTVQASCHYVVDDKNIIQMIPDNEVAWHVGDKPRRANLPIRRQLVPAGDSANNYFIGIEMCVNTNSNYADTLKNTKYLINVLLARHKLTIDNVYRHYDITAKDCPIMYQPDYVEMQYFDWSWITFKEYVRSSS